MVMNTVTHLPLCRGAGVDAPGLNAVRPLHRAAVEGLVSILGILLERGASPNELDSNLWVFGVVVGLVPHLVTYTYVACKSGGTSVC